MPWVSPSLQVKYGPYFRPDPAEQLQVVQMAQAALGKPTGVPIVTKQVAVEKIAAIFDVENVDALMDALEEEQAENDQRAADQASAQAELDAKTLHAAAGVKNAGGKPGAPGQQGGPKAPAAGGSGGAGAAAPAKK